MTDKPIVSIEKLPWTEKERGNFICRRKSLSQAAGGQKLGCSLYEVPVGCKAWPYHYHCGNEEAIYLLSGEGTLRLGEQAFTVKAGAYIALPPGQHHAHQLINTGEVPLQYLCFSTMNEPDVIAYPDSDKVGVFAGTAPGGDATQRTLNAFFPKTGAIDYWQDET